MWVRKQKIMTSGGGFGESEDQLRKHATPCGRVRHGAGLGAVRGELIAVARCDSRSWIDLFLLYSGLRYETDCVLRVSIFAPHSFGENFGVNSFVFVELVD